MVSLINTNDGRYLQYFTALESAIGLLSQWASEWSGGALFVPHAGPYLDRMRKVAHLLRSRFAFEINDPMVVDLLLSGFPNSFMLERLKVDERRCKTAEGMAPAELKRVFLDTLFKTGDTNTEILNAVSESLYRETLKQHQGEFDISFLMGGISTHDVGGQKTYRINWTVYDPIVNVPSTFGLVFEYTGEDVSDATTQLALVVRSESKAHVSIARIAQTIDSDVPSVRPKYLTRATLGPLHIPDFTAKEGEWDTIAAMYGLDDHLIIEIVVDHVYANSVVQPSALGKVLGRKQYDRQTFVVNTHDDICFDRGASAVERIALIPHALYQQLDAKDELIGKLVRSTKIIPYNNKGELLWQGLVAR